MEHDIFNLLILRLLQHTQALAEQAFHNGSAAGTTAVHFAKATLMAHSDSDMWPYRETLKPCVYKYEA